jgi:hypothetical protein
LKDEALDRTWWKTRFGRGYGPFVRQTAEWMNKQANKQTNKNGMIHTKLKLSINITGGPNAGTLMLRHVMYTLITVS